MLETVPRQPRRHRREGQRLSRLDRGGRGAARRSREPGHRGLRSRARTSSSHKSAEAAPTARCCALWIEKRSAQPPRGHPAAPGQGGGQLRLAHGRQVGARSAPATTRSCWSTSTGFVAEGPTTNVFLVEADGGLCTPARGDGAARRDAQLASSRSRKHDGIPVRVDRPFAPSGCSAAAEVFLTGTTAGVWPVGFGRRRGRSATARRDR